MTSSDTTKSTTSTFSKCSKRNWRAFSTTECLTIRSLPGKGPSPPHPARPRAGPEVRERHGGEPGAAEEGHRWASVPTCKLPSPADPYEAAGTPHGRAVE